MGRMLLKWIFNMWNKYMDWTDLAEDRDRWRVIVKLGAP
jgi:hypothetical protein